MCGRGNVVFVGTWVLTDPYSQILNGCLQNPFILNQSSPPIIGIIPAQRFNAAFSLIVFCFLFCLPDQPLQRDFVCTVADCFVVGFAACRRLETLSRCLDDVLSSSTSSVKLSRMSQSSPMTASDPSTSDPPSLDLDVDLALHHHQHQQHHLHASTKHGRTRPLDLACLLLRHQLQAVRFPPCCFFFFLDGDGVRVGVGWSRSLLVNFNFSTH